MGKGQSFGNLIEVGDVILHSDILTDAATDAAAKREMRERPSRWMR